MFPWRELEERNDRAIDYINRKGRERREHLEQKVKDLWLAVTLLWTLAAVLFFMLSWA